MLAKAIALWVVGLVTLVPYGTYYLLFEAPRDQYALLIASILFWVFGYWSVAGPLLMTLKARRVLRNLGSVRTQAELTEALKGADARSVAIDFIATENHVPRFIAAWLYQRLIDRIGERGRSARS